MITAVEIENFKGIRERTRIEIKPITLLFGPNSAGKSTLLHALQLAREIVTRGNLDVDVTDGGADFIDLGGFSNYVHGRDMKKVVTLRFELDLSGTNFLNEFPIPEVQIPIPSDALGRRQGGRSDETIDASTVGDDIQSGCVEFTIGCSDEHDTPTLLQYSVWLDGEPFASVIGDQLWQLNLHHPLTLWARPSDTSFGLLDLLFPDARPRAHQHFLAGEPIEREELLKPRRGIAVVLAGVEEGAKQWELRVGKPTGFDTSETIYARSPDGRCVRIWGLRFKTSDRDVAEAERYLRALPTTTTHCGTGDWNSLGHWPRPGICDDFDWADLHTSSELLIQNSAPNGIPDWDREFVLSNSLAQSGGDGEGTPAGHFELFTKLISRLMLVPGRVLRRCLGELRYVGPVRDAVPRSFAPQRFPEPRRWAGGLAAWEALARDSGSLVSEVDKWLKAEERLNTKLGVKVEQYRELAADEQLSALLESGGLAEDADADTIRRLFRNLPLKRRPMLYSCETQQALCPADVGQGITQAVPVVVAALHSFSSGPKVRGGLVAIEQPELHLNPRQQAALGDVFLAATLQSPRNRFILETHSEHLILRLQRRIREATERREFLRNGSKRSRKPSVPPPERTPSDDPLTLDVRDVDVGVVYVRNTEGRTLFEEMPLDLTGDFVMPWPDDFFEIDFHERFGP